MSAQLNLQSTRQKCIPIVEQEISPKWTPD